MNKCGLCEEVIGNASSEFTRIYGKNPENRLILERDGFIAIPSIGQMVEGYLLIVTKQHYTSMGSLPVDDLNELNTIMEEVRGLLADTYGRPIFFEHGSMKDVNSGGCGIDHAHIHAVPLPDNTDVLPDIQEALEGVEIASLADLSERARQNKPYLFYENQKGIKYLFDVKNIPCQYMRRILGKRLGCQEWDWRTYGREEKLISTLARLRNGKTALQHGLVTCKERCPSERH